MNVALVNPMSVLGLCASSNGAVPKPSARRGTGLGQAGAGAPRREAALPPALHELHRLDDRELDDLDLARADLPALAWRHAKRLEPLART